VSKALDAKELRFADAQLLMENLGVEPGSVTPFALINDTEKKVTVVLDSGLCAHKELGFHPLKNDATVIITPENLEKFIKSCGNQAMIFDFTAI
jgi:Ala-tRNA(Pro) deacylase